MLVAFILALMLPLFVQSQDSNFGNWFVYIGNKKLNSKWNIHHKTIGDLEQLLVQTGVGYNLSENNDYVLLGYGYIVSENHVNTTND